MRPARNIAGRDFVVGDLHGMFDALARLLDEVEFDRQRDRLFSVGDLVDRGPQSAQVLEWLGEPWFHACRGNHEQFVLDADDAEHRELWVGSNGGAWWQTFAPDDRERLRDAILELPFAIEIETDDGALGIVHADVPAGVSWQRFLELLEVNRQEALIFAMWSRQRLQGLGAAPVAGVDWVFCGHTPTRGVLRVDNVCYLDTGAVFGLDGFADGRLTLIELHPPGQREYSISTHPGATPGDREVSAPGS